MRRALWITFALSSFGTVFSGSLTWRELFGSTALACPSPGAPGTIFGYPACVYGFGMFLALAFTSGVALWTTREPVDRLPHLTPRRAP